MYPVYSTWENTIYLLTKIFTYLKIRTTTITTTNIYIAVVFEMPVLFSLSYRTGSTKLREHAMSTIKNLHKFFII